MKVIPFSPELVEALKTTEIVHPHIKRFTEEEKAEFRETIADASIVLEDTLEELKETKKSYKEIIDTQKSIIKENLKHVRKGCAETSVDAVLVPDFDNGLMHIYDKTTYELLDYRKLRPDEKQLNIHSISKTAN